MFLAADRMKLRSSSVFGRRAVSCLVIDGFGPASWKLWKGKVYYKSMSDGVEEATQLQRMWSGLNPQF